MTLMAAYAATMRHQQMLPTISNSGLLIAIPAYTPIYSTAIPALMPVSGATRDRMACPCSPRLGFRQATL